MATDLETFFDIYVRPSAGSRLDRNGFAARYAAAALLVACSRADDDEDPEEQRVIGEILSNTFELSARTISQILRLVGEDSGDRTLTTVTALVNEHYSGREKRALLRHIWRVAFADGRVDVYEERFIARVAGLLELSPDDVAEARAMATPG